MLTPVVLGVDVGGSKLLACAVDRQGRVRARRRRATGRATSPSAVIAMIESVARELGDEGLEVTAAGAGVPGLVDHRSGRVSSSCMLDGWHEVPLAAELAHALGVPCAVDNDANAALLQELATRSAAGLPLRGLILFAGVGTGIGGALAIDGSIHRGAAGLAGELGHLPVDPRGVDCWCGRRGCLNTVASGSAIEARAGLEPGTLEAAWRQGDRAAIAAAMEAAGALGRALAAVFHLLDPALVTLGGGVAELGGAWLAEVRRALAEAAFPEAAAGLRLEAARSGYDAGALGAARLFEPAAVSTPLVAAGGPG